MMKHDQVLILSDEKGIGKTTALQDWVKKTANVAGFLSPVIDGKRMFQEIETGTLMAMETENRDLNVGKYVFDSKSFEHAKKKIVEAWESAEANYIVIDEIGPLEINKDQGFHELLLRLQEDRGKGQTNLLLVIRDYCLDAFLNKYYFKNVETMSLKQFQKYYSQ